MRSGVRARRRPKSFPPSYWEPFFHGFVYLKELLATDWERRIRLDPPEDPEAELDAVQRLAEKRPERLEDILAQDDSERFWGYFTRRLMFTRGSHPRTHELLWVGAVASYPVIFHYKARFNRARPVQYDPAIDPAIETPGHPSYPSGHSTQAHLAALALAAVVPEARDELTRLAREIAENREVAGVHYPSDSAAGESLARQLFPILRACPGYGRLLAAARREWR
jgi:hypothetical protein